MPDSPANRHENVTTPVADSCPQCGAHLVSMTGDGVIETLCGSCGFVMRQHPPKAVPHEPYELTRLGDVIPEPITVVLRSSPRPRRRVHRAWLVGWALALYCIYVTMAGADSYLPIYLADEYLGVFGVALAIHRVLYADRKGQPMPDGPLAVMGLFILAVVSGYGAAALAPTIGERNYCFATNSSLLTRQVPHVFRCTYSPFFFAGFVGAFWVLGWLMIRWAERED